MALSPNRSRQFKTALIGDSAVGKTSIRRNYMGKSFVTSHIATLGVDFAQKNVEHSDAFVRITIWDLAGEHSYENVRKLYYQGTHSIIFVYSIIDRDSFQNAANWFNEVNRYCKPLPPIAILGNKVDLRDSASSDQVSKEEGIQFAEDFALRFGIPVIFRETSALSGENIEDVFDDIITMMLNLNPVREHSNRFY
ncbi:MAG: GTP-binding protein [Candidatus Thorarchaeota archaeon]